MIDDKSSVASDDEEEIVDKEAPKALEEELEEGEE